MDALVEDRPALFRRVLAHLDEVESEPASQPLNEELLRRAQRNVDWHIPRSILWEVLGKGEKLLQVLQEDPTPLTRLLQQVVLHIPFDELKTTISAEKLTEGLEAPSVPIQMLILAYLYKAADLPSGAAFVACNPTLVMTLVTTWLASHSTEVADRALEVLVALLDVDSTANSTTVTSGNKMGQAQGQGLLWRRIFHDATVYALLYEWTSLIKSKHDVQTKKGLQQATISQGRLFDFIARLAQIDWAEITTSTVPDVENQFRKENNDQQPYGGILRYAATDMIDPSDYLMEVLRQDFFLRLLRVVEDQNSPGVTPRLLEAIQSGAGVENLESVGRNGLHL